jgi:hypothetical protein
MNRTGGPAQAAPEPLVDEAIATIFIICRGALMLSTVPRCHCRLRLSPTPLELSAVTAGRSSRRGASSAPGNRPLLALAYLRKGETLAELAVGFHFSGTSSSGAW